MGGKRKQSSNWPVIPNWKPFVPTSEKKALIASANQDTKNTTTTPADHLKSLEIPPGWKEAKFEAEDNPHHRLFSSTSFSTLFPKYREKYLRKIWPIVKKILKEHFIRADLDVVEGTMLVKTTPKTFDPMIILKARDLICLLARSMPLDQAQRVLEDEIFCDIIPIHLNNKARFLKRRNRFVGPDGATLKAIEILTKCYITIQGKTVSAVGPWTGLREVRKLAQDTMKNIHPIYGIKTLMIKQKLKEDPKMVGVSWDKYLPKFKPKSLSRRRKPHEVHKKGDYTPFPPAQLESKVDKELREGTYFLKSEEKERLNRFQRQKKQEDKGKERKRQRQAVLVAPPE